MSIVFDEVVGTVEGERRGAQEPPAQAPDAESPDQARRRLRAELATLHRLQDRVRAT